MKKLLLIALLIVGCDELLDATKHGCIDSQACNYDAEANLDNNSCIYTIDCEGVCGGEDTSCVGCDDVRNSGLVLDDCGVCGGDGGGCALVGIWNVTNIKYFETLDCSGNPLESLDVNSLEELAVYGMDEYQIKLTITSDSQIVAIETTSSDTSYVREEKTSTGIIVDHGDQFCVNWETEDTDGCDECRDYSINGDEATITSMNCPLIVPPHPNIPCQIYTLVKQ